MTDTLALKLLLTPILIATASLAGRRWGQAVGGWLVGLPLTSGPVAFFLALEHGAGFAAVVAFGSLAGALAEAAFCVAYGCRRAAAGRSRSLPPARRSPSWRLACSGWRGRCWSSRALPSPRSSSRSGSCHYGPQRFAGGCGIAIACKRISSSGRCRSAAVIFITGMTPRATYATLPNRT